MTAPVTHLADRAAGRDRGRPARVLFSGTRKGLVIATALITEHELADCNVSVWSGGTIVVLDYSEHRHAAGEVRIACQKLGLLVEELASETPDGSAAIELRGSGYQDGVLRTVRAVIPVPATWGAL